LNSTYPIDVAKGVFGFEGALFYLKRGMAVQRTGWNGKNMYIKIQNPSADNKMTLSYIYIRTVQGDFVPWLASQTDLLSEDWQIVLVG
jgi:hypothetical protein